MLKDLNFKYITPKEFNELYGYSTYNKNKYIMAREEDIGLYVAMKVDSLNPLPYMSDWEEHKSIKSFNKKLKDKNLNENDYINFHYISTKGLDLNNKNHRDKILSKETQYLLKATGTRDLVGRLATNKEYKSLYGIEEGFFQDRPFVTVLDDSNKKLTCHLSRFEIIKELKE